MIGLHRASVRRPVLAPRSFRRALRSRVVTVFADVTRADALPIELDPDAEEMETPDSEDEVDEEIPGMTPGEEADVGDSETEAELEDEIPRMTPAQEAQKAAAQAAAEAATPTPTSPTYATPNQPGYVLNVVWLEKAVGLAVDQYLSSGERGPVTEYFMWPANDAWDQLRVRLDSMPWISQVDSVHVLNDATGVINFWQDEETKHTIDEAKEKFPHITFYGS